MSQTDQQFSTQKITPQLISQVIDALKNKAYGSVEIYIQNYTVTQITERTITKVSSPKSSRKLTEAKNNGHGHKFNQDLAANTWFPPLWFFCL